MSPDNCPQSQEVKDLKMKYLFGKYEKTELPRGFLPLDKIIFTVILFRKILNQ